MIYSKATSIGACVGSVAAVYSYKKNLQAKELIACHDCHMKRLPKAKELPLYDKEDDNMTAEYDEATKLPLTTQISGIREKSSVVLSYLGDFKKEAVHIYETGVAHSQSTFDYMNSEENKVPRIAAITSGGLVGLFLARKGGVFKKLIYTSTGTGLLFSAFYPSIAKQYLSCGFEFTKKHASNALEKYGGVDTEQMAKQTNEKVDYVLSVMRFEGVKSKLNEWFYRNKETISKTLNGGSKGEEKFSKDETEKK